VGRNGFGGVLIMFVSAIVPEESRGNKKCDEEPRGGGGGRTTNFWHRCKMAMTWLYAMQLF